MRRWNEDGIGVDEVMFTIWSIRFGELALCVGSVVLHRLLYQAAVVDLKQDEYFIDGQFREADFLRLHFLLQAVSTITRLACWIRSICSDKRMRGTVMIGACAGLSCPAPACHDSHTCHTTTLHLDSNSRPGCLVPSSS